MWVVRMRSVLRFTASRGGRRRARPCARGACGRPRRPARGRAPRTPRGSRGARRPGAHREVGGGAVDVQVGARRVAQGGDHLDEARPARALVDAGVEALVELEVAPRGRGVAHLVEQQLERRGPIGLEALGGARGGKRLQRGADLVVLAQVGDGRDEDHGAALRVQPDEALALERGQRLAHRRGAHAEAARDLDLPQPAARLQRRRRRSRPAGARRPTRLPFAGRPARRLPRRWTSRQYGLLTRRVVECANFPGPTTRRRQP